MKRTTNGWAMGMVGQKSQRTEQGKILSTLERAIEIAAIAHARQVDKGGSPYILHPLRVMMTLKTLEERIVAVLHDVVEDSDWTFDRLRAEGFSDDVLDAIDAVTRRAGESYEEFVRRARLSEIGRVVKLADLMDNRDLSRIPSPTQADRQRVLKYDRAIAMLA